MAEFARLSAGGNRIRTIGPTVRDGCFEASDRPTSCLYIRAWPDRAPLANLCARRNRRVSRPCGGRSSPEFRRQRPRRRHGPLSLLPGALRVYVARAVIVLLGAAPRPSRSRTRLPIPRTTHRTTSRTTWRDAAPPGYAPPATRDQQLGGSPAPPGNPGTHTPISPGADRAWG